MFASIFVLLAIAGAASATPPAQATYCYEDNLLRAFQHTPTPASDYCTSTTGYPTFLSVKSYPATRLSSACSCFSRFPTEPTPCATPVPTAGTVFSFSSTGDSGIAINILLTIDLNQPCASTGYLIVNACGTFGGQPISFNPSDNLLPPTDYCFFPSTLGAAIDYDGLDFEAPAGHLYNMYHSDGQAIQITDVNVAGPFYPGSFQAATCAKCPT